MVDAHVRAGGEAEAWTDIRFKHASVLIQHQEAEVWPVKVVHVLPRARGLLIGSVGNLTQGKAGNQLGALRFAEGHFVQMMDANMGCYSGETFKVPVVLQGFHKSPGRPNLAHLRSSRLHLKYLNLYMSIYNI